MGLFLIIEAIAKHIDTIRATNETIDGVADLPRVLSEVMKLLPLVVDKLTTAQPRLESATMLHYESISTIAKHCSKDVIKLEDIFQALENRCKQDQGSKSWATIRPSYLQELQWNKERRIECLMKQILGKVKELCLYEAVLLPTEDIDHALNELAEAGPSLDDSEFSQKASIVAQQTVNEGGFGQQNNPNGGSNTFNSGYNISGGTVNFGHLPTALG